MKGQPCHFVCVCVLVVNQSYQRMRGRLKCAKALQYTTVKPRLSFSQNLHISIGNDFCFLFPLFCTCIYAKFPVEKFSLCIFIMESCYNIHKFLFLDRNVLVNFLTNSLVIFFQKNEKEKIFIRQIQSTFFSIVTPFPKISSCYYSYYYVNSIKCTNKILNV